MTKRKLEVTKGIDDLCTTHPDIAKLWAYDLNGSITPDTIRHNTKHKFYFRCEHGHVWKASLSDMTRPDRSHSKTRCPYCSHKKAISGVNDLETLYPDIAKSWDYEKNDILLPSEVLPHSHKRVWWKCEKGHSWQTTIENRVLFKNGCPYCSGNKVLVGFNDLATLNPELASQWHPTKNGTLTPKDVTSKSGKIVWWKGTCGHEWKAKIESRTYGSDCPKCTERYRTSFCEQAIFFYLKQLDNTVQNMYSIDGINWDIVIPYKNIIIEHDGSFWHSKEKTKARDKYKTEWANQNGYTLYRVQGSNDKRLKLHDIIREGNIITYRDIGWRDIADDFKIIINILTTEIYGENVDVNLIRDENSIKSQYLKKNYTVSSDTVQD